MAVKDETIKKDVVDQLYWDASVDASRVKVEVMDKKVILSGTVPSIYARLQAERDAYRIPEVAVVDNQLKVEQPPALPVLTDDELKTRVENTLTWASTLYTKNVLVSVVNEKVTLEGTVGSYWEKTRAEELVCNIAGVRDVTNALVVVPTEKIPDESVAVDVIRALERTRDIDVNAINVRVEDGAVTLSGTVLTTAAKNAAFRAARYTSGVVSVENNLSVSE